MDVILDNFGVASLKFVQFLYDYQGHFKEFQQAVDEVSDFASAHHGELAASSGLIRLIGFARGSHANHARLTAEKIPAMIRQYRSQIGGSAFTKTAKSDTATDTTELPSTQMTVSPTTASPRIPLSSDEGGISSNASPFAPVSGAPRPPAPR